MSVEASKSEAIEFVKKLVGICFAKKRTRRRVEENATLLLAVFDGYTIGSPEYPHYVAAAGMDTGKRYHWWRREPANIGQMMYFGDGHPGTEVVRVYATGGW